MIEWITIVLSSLLAITVYEGTVIMHVYVCCVQAWLIAMRRQSQCKMTNSICHDTTSSHLVHERETQARHRVVKKNFVQRYSNNQIMLFAVNWYKFVVSWQSAKSSFILFTFNMYVYSRILLVVNACCRNDWCDGGNLRLLCRVYKLMLVRIRSCISAYCNFVYACCMQRWSAVIYDNYDVTGNESINIDIICLTNVIFRKERCIALPLLIWR